MSNALLTEPIQSSVVPADQSSLLFLPSSTESLRREEGLPILENLILQSVAIYLNKFGDENWKETPTLMGGINLPFFWENIPATVSLLSNRREIVFSEPTASGSQILNIPRNIAAEYLFRVLEDSNLLRTYSEEIGSIFKHISINQSLDIKLPYPLDTVIDSYYEAVSTAGGLLYIGYVDPNESGLKVRRLRSTDTDLIDLNVSSIGRAFTTKEGADRIIDQMKFYIPREQSVIIRDALTKYLHIGESTLYLGEVAKSDKVSNDKIILKMYTKFWKDIQAQGESSPQHIAYFTTSGTVTENSIGLLHVLSAIMKTEYEEKVNYEFTGLERPQSKYRIVLFSKK